MNVVSLLRNTTLVTILNKNRMNCELHNKQAELCESHIIPKFVYNWMKKTGTGRFRQLGKFNSPLQDGIKKHMLCKNCEDKFSVNEKWFSEKVFSPYLNNSEFVVKNEKELKYFVVSVLWRILKLFKDDGNKYNFKSELNNVEIEWRNFLLSDIPISKYDNFHLILINSDYWIDEKSDFYFSRAVDIEIAENEKISFIYAKFSRFILIGEIIGLNKKSFLYTNLAFESEFRSDNQIINEELIIDQRVIDFIEEFKDNKLTVVIGSSWPADEKLLVNYINRSRTDVKFIIAPHNIKREQIVELQNSFQIHTSLHKD